MNAGSRSLGEAVDEMARAATFVRDEIRWGMVRSRLVHARVASARRDAPIPHALRNDDMVVAQCRIFGSFAPRRLRCELHLIRLQRVAGDLADYGWSEFVDGPVSEHLLDVPHQMMDVDRVANVAVEFRRIFGRS